MPAPKLTRKIAAAPRARWCRAEGQRSAATSARAGRSGYRRRRRCRVLQSRRAPRAATESDHNQHRPGNRKTGDPHDLQQSEHRQGQQRATANGSIRPCCRSSSTGASRPSASISTPVKRPICPIRIESEMPMKNPVRMGRDRKVARMPSRSTHAAGKTIRRQAPALRRCRRGPLRGRPALAATRGQHPRKHRHRRRVRTDDELPRGAKQRVGDQRRDAGVDAGLGRQPRYRGIGDGAGKPNRGDRQARRDVVAQPSPAVAAETG